MIPTTLVLAVDSPGPPFSDMAREISRGVGNLFTDVHIVEASKLTSKLPGHVVVVAFWWGDVCRLRANLQPNAMVACVHDHESYRDGPSIRPDFKLALQQIDVLSVCNETISAEITQLCAHPKMPQIFVTPNGVNTRLFTLTPMPRGMPIAGWCGNSTRMGSTSDYKGLGLVREACKAANVELHILDSSKGPPRPLHAMPDFYQSITAIICMAQREGAPLPIFEGMACGRIPISTKVGTAQRAIKHKINGFLLEHRSMQCLADALLVLKRTAPDVRNTIGRHARAEVEKRWSWDITLQAWYQCLLAAKRIALDAHPTTVIRLQTPVSPVVPVRMEVVTPPTEPNLAPSKPPLLRAIIGSPHCHVPERGQLAPRTSIDAVPPERVLVLHMGYSAEPLSGLERAFGHIKESMCLSWTEANRKGGPPYVESDILDAARALRPTLVWWQIQGQDQQGHCGGVNSDFIPRLRAVCDPNCLITSWNGDVRRGASDLPEEWPLQSAREIDILLSSNCTDPIRFLSLGVHCTGYLPVGYDPDFSDYRPDAGPQLGEEGCVFLGQNYTHLDRAYRQILFETVEQRLPGVLHLFGHGWSPAKWPGRVHPFVPEMAASYIYSRARVSICTSLFTDLRRYSSDRLMRALGSGACVALQAFDDYEGLGIKDGIHALIWRTPQDLVQIIEDWLRPERDTERIAMRQAARTLARSSLTWDAVVEKFLAIVQAERKRRADAASISIPTPVPSPRSKRRVVPSVSASALTPYAVFDPCPQEIDCSIILGTVNRTDMLRDCIESIRVSLGVPKSKYSYEIVVAHGTAQDASLPWLRAQKDVVLVLGGMDGAIPAFNRAYATSRGRYIAQINDDVVIEGASLANAIEHLDRELDLGAVIFYMSRDGGKTYLRTAYGDFCPKKPGLPHPNQIVARRELCEDIIAEGFGAFWGDESVMTHRTYGGDSAWGLWASRLGWRIERKDNVKLKDHMDQTGDDPNRAVNVEPTAYAEHMRKWCAAYAGDFALPIHRAEMDWPNVYNPKRGRFPRRSPINAGPPERVLHLALSWLPKEPQPDLHRNLAAIGPYHSIRWLERFRAIGPEQTYEEVFAAIREHQPTLIWMQVQQPHAFGPDVIRRMRELSPPNCLIVSWTGDVTTDLGEPLAPWMIEQCQALDLFLSSECTYPEVLHSLGVPARTGHMICGGDTIENSPRTGKPENWVAAGKACFVGSTHYQYQEEASPRTRLMQTIGTALPGQVVCYGTGWDTVEGIVPGPFVSKPHRAELHSVARVTIIQSLFHRLRRYTSDRLQGSLLSRAFCAVQAFDDMEGYGLQDGLNCIVWRDARDLTQLLKDWLRPAQDSARESIRTAGRDLALRHLTWTVGIEQLLAIVRTERRRRATGER